jgi:hypothetical protein
MSWGEAHRLSVILASDPSSAVAAALNEWSHPVTREAMTLADLFDSSEAARVGRRAKPYPRPWRTKTRTFGRSTLTREELRAVLDTHRR